MARTVPGMCWTQSVAHSGLLERLRLRITYCTLCVLIVCWFQCSMHAIMVAHPCAHRSTAMPVFSCCSLPTAEPSPPTL